MVEPGNKPTPEEELLRLIEEPSEKPAKPTVITEKTSGVSLSLRLVSGMAAVKARLFGVKGISLKTVNRLLGILTLLLMAYLVWDIIAPPSIADVSLRPKRDKIGPDVKPSQDLSSILTLVSARNIFKPVPKPEPKQPPEEVKRPVPYTPPTESPIKAPKEAEIKKLLKIRGVCWEPGAPAVVMLEHTKGGQTYLVSEQDEIGLAKVRLTVQKISWHGTTVKVILQYTDGTVELDSFTMARRLK